MISGGDLGRGAAGVGPGSKAASFTARPRDIATRPWQGGAVGDFLFVWLPMVVGISACLCGSYLIWLGFSDYSAAATLRRAGVRTTGTVVSKTAAEEMRPVGAVRRHGEGTTHYCLTYVFSVDARKFERSEVAPVDLWLASQAGSEVDVIYFPRDPAISRLAAWPGAIGHIAGAAQLAVGVGLTGLALGWLVTGSLAALSGPEHVRPGAGWVPLTATVERVRLPEDPFLRLLAPGARIVDVEIGRTDNVDAMGTHREVLVYPEQLARGPVVPGDRLPALMDPENEENAILALESEPL